MAQTLVVCTNCKAIFPSPIGFGNRKSFETSKLKGNTVKCPKCGATVPCNKENMIFKE
jgi:DNA-directed RNA polymerase subunit RPC12/RpoP